MTDTTTTTIAPAATPDKPAALTDEQKTRAAALHEARKVLGARAFMSSGQVDPVGVISVASWIVDGENPWRRPRRLFG